jgi:hypothetical protein
MRVQIPWTTPDTRRDLAALRHFDKVLLHVYRADQSQEVLTPFPGMSLGNDSSR